MQVLQGVLATNSLDTAPLSDADPIFALLHEYRCDSRDNKVDFGIGVYRDAAAASPVFAAVKAAEQWRVDTEQNKNYIGPLGDSDFCQRLCGLAMGEDLAKDLAARLACAQTPGGVGALRLAFELIGGSGSTLWLSDTTWQVHLPIAQASGLAVRRYDYYQPGLGRLPFEQVLASLSQAKAGDAVLIQGSCHNPTGLDFTADEWQQLSSLCLQKCLLPIVDMAYHGLGVGIEEERLGLVTLLKQLPELLLCYTCSKNFGLYRERTGMVVALTENSQGSAAVSQQWMQLATRHYFTPPAHGASSVRKILQESKLKKNWLTELEVMRNRLVDIRKNLSIALNDTVPDRDWSFLIQGAGMFALFPMSKQELIQLKKQLGIYIVENGRVNLSSFNSHNIDSVVHAIAEVCGNASHNSECELSGKGITNAEII
jgi:aspartate/tyrosine/aromatic aminotransferase